MSSDRPVDTTEDEDVKSRKHKRNDDSGIEELLAGAIHSMSTDQQQRHEHHSSMLRIELERSSREAREADRREAMHLEELKAKKWAAYYKSLDHTDEFSQLRTKKLKQELQELESL